MTRELIELAVESGRKRQSKQTGFVHYCYHVGEEEQHYPIPVLENVLFALALMRTRISDNVLEGKTLIEKLLPFQKKTFPLYLHDFPHCHDHFLAIHLIPPFYWILKYFHQVVGQELKGKLEERILELISYALNIYEEKNVPYHFGVKLGAGVKAVGLLLNQQELLQKGDKILEDHLNKAEVAAWLIPESIADILIGLQMVYPSIVESPWKGFWEHLNKTWNKNICTYVGPGLKEFQEGGHPQTTLYDLYMGYFSDKYSKRALVEKAWHLQAALIQESSDRLSAIENPLFYEGKTKNEPWITYQTDSYSFSLLEKISSIHPSMESLFHALKVVWGNAENVHSFVNQVGNNELIQYVYHPRKDHEQELDLIFTLGEMIQPEDKEKNREVSFYFDVVPETKILIEGKAATTFQLQETISIEYDHLKISLEFILEEGEGQFFGHIMRGNRPAQLPLKGIHRFKSYDWQIFLRTIRRSPLCKIRAKIRLECYE